MQLRQRAWRTRDFQQWVPDPQHPAVYPRQLGACNELSREPSRHKNRHTHQLRTDV
jgi:hypothetical protein